MNKRVVGLSCDFVQDNGHFLVLGGDGQLKSTELADLQIQMLQANTIPKLLPLHVEELNLTASLRYDLTGKRMFSKAIPSSRFNLTDYYSVLLAIVTAIEDGGAYMLYETHFVLEEDFIFVGEQLTDVYLMYVPVKQVPQPIPLAEAFRSLALNWIGFVKEVRGDGLQTVLNYCKTDTFSAAELKKLLQQVLHAEIARPIQSAGMTAAPAAAPAAFAGVSPVQEGAARPAQPPVIPPQTPAAKPQAAASSAARPLDPKPPAAESNMPVALTQREKIVLLLLLALGNAVIWRLYIGHAGEGSLLISLGVTLLTLDAAYVYVQFRHELQARFRRGSGKVEVAAAKERITKAPQVQAPKAAKRQRGAKDVEPNPIEFDKSQAAAQPSPLDAGYYNQLSMQTTLLNRPEYEKTVLLNAMQASAAKPVPQLEVRKDGQTTFHPLAAQPFVIGRGGPSVQFEDNTVGISRMHVEIQQDNGMWYAKDLGSKNGSLFNDQPMVAYKAYPLKDGDVVKIVKTEFVFRSGPV